MCLMIYRPVCDKSGKQYSNECVAKCAGALRPDPAKSQKHHASAPRFIGQFVTKTAKNTRTNAWRSVPEQVRPDHAKSQKHHASAPRFTGQFVTKTASNTRTNA